MQCPTCASEIEAGAITCQNCGGRLSPAAEMTTPSGASSRDEAPTVDPAGGSPAVEGDRSADHAFIPGTLFAGRYRIVGRIGAGGSGTVYRADDLRLGRPVALKFLSERFLRDPSGRHALLNEVRLALRVSHPNVCRVHDIGEAGGRPYLSMEYVDGEDLASLLRRIGRLPQDKVVDVIRQLAAGLGAAHHEGVLHRDLKPANVMIDSRGHVKITDFGLATHAGERPAEERLAGTPSYMAPEQWRGEPLSPQTDLYALGLVAYEALTGVRAFEADTLDRLRRRHLESFPEAPSRLVEGLDPRLERLVLACLAKDPAGRPPSALAVLAALPGGDPLSEVVRSGRTPSPEMVAEAARGGGLAPRSVGLAVLLAVGLTTALLALSARTQLTELVPLDKAPIVLEDRARTLLGHLGYDESARDRLYSFEPRWGYLRELWRTERGEALVRALGRRRPPSVLFGYRDSPAPMIRWSGGALGRWLDDPPVTAPGMRLVMLDPSGRLYRLVIVPADRRQPALEAPVEVDWSPLLAAAGFDPDQLTPSTPSLLTPVPADSRAAWTGPDPEEPARVVRLEAAALAGRPVFFTFDGEDAAGPAGDAGWAPTGRAWSLLGMMAYAGMLVGAGMLALRNLRRGRGDRRAALCVGLYLGGLRLAWLVGAHHAGAMESALLRSHLAWAAYRVCAALLLYLAVEPYYRRSWPHMMVSWMRVLDGRLRDALVGRDILLGALGGLCLATLRRGAQAAALALEARPVDVLSPQVRFWMFEALRGPRQTLAALFGLHVQILLSLFAILMIFLFTRLITGRTWVAIVAMTLVFAGFRAADAAHPALQMVLEILFLGAAWLILFRLGLVAFIVAWTLCYVVLVLPLTWQMDAWYSGTSLFVLVLLAVLVGYGAITSLSGRRPPSDDLAWRLTASERV